VVRRTDQALQRIAALTMVKPFIHDATHLHTCYFSMVKSFMSQGTMHNHCQTVYIFSLTQIQFNFSLIVFF